MAASCYNLATSYNKIREYHQALAYGRKALRTRKKIYGEKHCDVAKSYVNLAVYYSKTEEYDQAIECGTKALSSR